MVARRTKNVSVADAPAMPSHTSVRPTGKLGRLCSAASFPVLGAVDSSAASITNR